VDRPKIEENGIDLPFILDGLEDNEFTRTSDFRGFLETNGVTFPRGAAAIYYPQAGLLGLKNTAENIRKVCEIMKILDLGQTVLLRIEVRVMEYRPDVETKLAGQGTFADLEARLGDSVKTVCISSVIMGSGQHAEGRLDSDNAKPSGVTGPPSKAKRAAVESETWPPPANVQRALLGIEATLMAVDKRSEPYADIHIDF
jgi:hypothetical protein